MKGVCQKFGSGLFVDGVDIPLPKDLPSIGYCRIKQLEKAAKRKNYQTSQSDFLRAHFYYAQVKNLHAVPKEFSPADNKDRIKHFKEAATLVRQNMVMRAGNIQWAVACKE